MKKGQLKEVTLEVSVGGFILTMLFVLGFFSIIIAHDNFLKETYPMSVYFEDVSGLKDGENVRMRGVRVGKVREITMREGSSGVDVLLSLEQPVQLRITEIKRCSDGFSIRHCI